MGNSQSKIDFILNLVQRGGLSDSDFRRLRKLAAAEIRSIEENGGSLTNGIDKLKEKLLLDFIGGEKDQVTPSISKYTDPIQVLGKEEQDIRAIHPPNQKAHHVAEFMALFNDPKGLKYLTHDYDPPEPFDIDDFLKEAWRVFNDSAYDLDIPPNLYIIIKNFAFEPNLGSFEKSQKTGKREVIHWRGIDNKKRCRGWSTPKILKWSRDHSEHYDSKGQNPHPYHHQEFKDDIDAFRNVTRVKAPSFWDLVNQSITAVFGSKNTKFDITCDRSLRKADFYSHVPNIKKAVKTIFELIKEHKKPIVKIYYSRDKTEKEYHIGQLEIVQYDSYADKELSDLCDHWFSEKGSMGKIKSLLKGYCDWSVETKAPDGDGETSFRINILRSKEMKILEDVPEEDIVGFKHIIKFYYK